MMAYVDENGNISSTPPEIGRKKSTIRAEDIQVSTPKQENVKADAFKQGVVVYFNESKGYGFINDNITQARVFFHIKGLIDPVQENDKVTFETEKTLKGLNAFNIKLLK
jgi:cold shock CspA family protein